MQKLSNHITQYIQDFGNMRDQCNLCTTCKKYNKDINITDIGNDFDIGMKGVFNVQPIRIELSYENKNNSFIFSDIIDLSKLKGLFISFGPHVKRKDIKSLLMKTDLIMLGIAVEDSNQLNDEWILHNQHLKELYIYSNCNLTDASISKLDLHALEINECKGITDDSIIKNKNLQNLYLYNCQQITAKSLSNLQLKTLLINNSEGPSYEDYFDNLLNIYKTIEYDAAIGDHPDVIASKAKIQSQKDTLEVLDIRYDPYVFNFDPTDFPKLVAIVCFKLSSINDEIILNHFKLTNINRITGNPMYGIITIGSRKIDVEFNMM
jgi:hypothetical protein